MIEPELLLALRARLLVRDGAMGTELQRAGLSPGACGELWNVDRPDAVRSIHREYRDAGADVLLTNTFGGSRLRLARHGLGDRATELNVAAARLAREAAGPRGFVLGDLGPSGGLLAPLGDTDPAELSAAFTEQARALVSGGVDAILIETMTAIEEMSLAVAAARHAGARVVFASFAFDQKANGKLRTMMGVAPDAACAAMLGAGVDGVGANCGTDLDAEAWLSIVRTYRSATVLPILVAPNAGRPELTADGARYRESPEALATRVRNLVTAGANLVGGCCGTTPSHIAAIARACRHGT